MVDEENSDDAIAIKESLRAARDWEQESDILGAAILILKSYDHHLLAADVAEIRLALEQNAALNREEALRRELGI